MRVISTSSDILDNHGGEGSNHDITKTQDDKVVVIFYAA